MKSFDQFQRRLDSLSWTPAGHIDGAVLDLLTEVGQDRGLIESTVKSWNAKNLDMRQLRCHETATHYKWFMHYDEHRGYKIWLHQYKSQHNRRVGHAEVPHNHRYSLASVILRGGFTHHYFRRDDNKVIELLEDRCRYSQGDVYSVEWCQVHSLSHVIDHTLTLVVETPAVRHYSEAYYDDSGDPKIFTDFVGLHPELAADLACL